MIIEDEILILLRIAHANRVCWRSGVFLLEVRVIISSALLALVQRDSKAFEDSAPKSDFLGKQGVLSFLERDV